MDNKNFTETYQTGSTQPPKSYRGVIAILLVLVIFLCGISTGLGLLNIHLFRKLHQSGAEDSLSFCHAEGETLPQSCQILGFSPKELDEFWRIYQEVPYGMYIAHVDEHSDAAKKGVFPGDVLLKLDDTPITSGEDLENWLIEGSDHSSVRVLLYRAGQELTVTVALNKP